MEDRAGKEKIRFVRANLKSGERLEFSYPASLRAARIICRIRDQEYRSEVPVA